MFSSKKWMTLIALVAMAAMILPACARPTPIVIEKEVPVDREVIKEIVVEKEVPVEVEKEVIVEKEVPVTVVVEKEVVVEKPVVETVVVEKEVVKEVVVEVTPEPGVPEVLHMSQCQAGCEPRYGGTLTYALVGEVIGGVWHAPWMFPRYGRHDMVYGSLYAYDPWNDKLIPDLASHWEISDDRTTVTFHLRPGVTFHNGDPFTAEDVEFSYKLVLDPEAGGATSQMADYGIQELKGAQDFIDGKTDDLAGLTVLDDYTVRFETEEPSFMFLRAGGAPFIVSKALLGDYSPEELPDLDWISPDITVGTGPFKLGEYVEAQYSWVVANEDYWPGRPYLDSIVRRIFDSHETASLAFEAGDLDLLDRISAEQIEYFREEPKYAGYAFLRAQYGNMNVMDINLDQPYLQDVRVRQAINHAIDRQGLIDAVVLPGMMIPIDTLMTPERIVYNPDPNLRWAYDPDKARALLAEAGWDADQELVLYSYYKDYAPAHDWLAVIQSYLADVGMKVKVNLVDWPTFEYEVYTERVHDLDFTGCPSGPFGEVEFTYGTGTTWNGSGWSNARVDEIWVEAKKLGSMEEMKPLFYEMQEIYHEELPSAPIWGRSQWWIVAPKVCGVVEDRTDMGHFMYFNYENIYICEESESATSVWPMAPASVGHPGYSGR